MEDNRHVSVIYLDSNNDIKTYELDIRELENLFPHQISEQIEDIANRGLLINFNSHYERIPAHRILKIKYKL